MTLYANIGELIAFGRYWRNRAELMEGDSPARMRGPKA
jgi:hypothetical protein